MNKLHYTVVSSPMSVGTHPYRHMLSYNRREEDTEIFFVLKSEIELDKKRMLQA